MALFNNWPWTKYNDYNLAWLLQKTKSNEKDIEELEKEFNDLLAQKVEEYIQENLSQFLLGAMYIEEDTAIKLQPATVIGDGDHVYNSSNEQIIVLEGR